MLRAILRLNHKDCVNGAECKHLYTLDFDAPELERQLTRGGRSESGYEFHELLGVEVLPTPQPLPTGPGEVS